MPRRSRSSWSCGEVVAASLLALTPLLACAPASADGSRGLGAELLVLAIVVAVGRTALSVLPAGPQGSHRPHDLPATLAASHLVGWILLSAQLRLFPHPDSVGDLWWLLLPWLLIALGRRLTAPGAMVPRHEPATEPAGPLARALRALFVVAALAPFVTVIVGRSEGLALSRWAELLPPSSESGLTAAACDLAALFGAEPTPALFATAAWLSLLILLSRAMLVARRAPLGRHAVASLIALMPFPIAAAMSGHELVATSLCLGAGVGFLIPWRRRADRRACVLAAISFGGSALSGVAVLALLGLVLLVAATPRPARRFALRAAAIAGIGGVGLAMLAGEPAVGWLDWSSLAGWRAAGAALLPTGLLCCALALVPAERTAAPEGRSA